MSMRFFATCKLGLESLVSFELKSLCIEVVQVADARVDFTGGFSALVKALLWLRTAERVFLLAGSFPAQSFEELFEGVKAIPWKQYIPKNAFIHVNGKSAKSGLFSVSDCQRIAKKAIVDNLREAYHTESLPETGTEIIVEVGLLRDTATVALDACGAGLSRRGYRTYNVDAPLSETLGAAIVLLSKYNGTRPFLDPMCGSGTMPIEAAMVAQNRAPGLLRSFSAENWRFLEQDLFIREREAAHDAIVSAPASVTGCDIDARSLALSGQHAKKAGVQVSFLARDVRDTAAKEDGGILCVNPPYGERLLKQSEVVRLYGDMRRAFSALSGWGVHIFSAHREFERAYGLRAHKRRKLSNGGLSCTLYQYFPKHTKT